MMDIIYFNFYLDDREISQVKQTTNVSREYILFRSPASREVRNLDIIDIRHFQSQFREFLTDQITNLIKYDLDICKKLTSFHRKDFFCVYTVIC